MIKGIDVSFYQGKIDWKRVKESGVQFAIIRGGQGRTKDTRFDYNWKAAADEGIKRGIYWFYEWRSGIDPGADCQADFLLDITKGNVGEMGVTCDYERPNSTWPALPSPAASNEKLWKFYDVLLNNNARADLFYTNLDGINTIKPQPWLKQKELWLAWYPTRWNWKKLRYDHETWLAYHLETGVTPTLPNTNWGKAPLFWQFTYFLDGINYGVQSKELDGDYYLGDNLNDFIKPTEAPQEEEDVKIVLKSKGNQNLRREPNLSNTPIRLLSVGETMNVDDLITDARGVWVYDKTKGYAAVYYDGKQYMTGV